MVLNNRTKLRRQTCSRAITLTHGSCINSIEGFTRTPCTAFNPHVKTCHPFEVKSRKKLLKNPDFFTYEKARLENHANSSAGKSLLFIWVAFMDMLNQKAG